MGKHVMVVQSRAKPGREAEYNHWYDTIHIPDVCAVPGVKSGRRYEATPIHVGVPGLPILAIYELEVDNPASVMAEIGKRAAEGTIRRTDALDAEASVMWFYSACGN
jgi:hypothetical protein